MGYPGMAVYMYNEQYHLVMYTGHSLHMERDCMDLEVKVVLAQLKQQITEIIYIYTRHAATTITHKLGLIY
jgi:hypothetical protein